MVGNGVYGMEWALWCGTGVVMRNEGYVVKWGL